MKKLLSILLILCATLTLCGATASWELPAETFLFEPGCVMETDFGSFTVLDAGFCKKVELGFSVNTWQKTVNGVKESGKTINPYYQTAKNGAVFFAVKGVLRNSSDRDLTVKELCPEIRFSDGDTLSMKAYPAVHVGNPEAEVIGPGVVVDISFACAVPNSVYYGGGDILMDFAGGAVGFPREVIGNYVSMGFTEQDGEEAGDITEIYDETQAKLEQRAANPDQPAQTPKPMEAPHFDELSVEDASLEYSERWDKYELNCKVRNNYAPAQGQTDPSSFPVYVQLLDEAGDVLPANQNLWFKEIEGGRAGWSYSPIRFAPSELEGVDAVRFVSYELRFEGSPTIKGKFSEPYVVSVSDLLAGKKPAARSSAKAADEQAADGGQFVLRNGITFGDSRLSVKEKEVFSLETTSNESMAGKGNIAGYDDSHVAYYFDSSDRLYEIVYVFQDLKDKNENSKRYETIYNSLVQKYGEPLDIRKGEFYPLTSRAFEFYRNAAGIISYTGRVAELESYNEWLVRDGDDYVKIDLVSTRYGSADSLNYNLWMGYRHFSSGEVDSINHPDESHQLRSDNDL